MIELRAGVLPEEIVLKPPDLQLKTFPSILISRKSMACLAWARVLESVVAGEILSSAIVTLLLEVMFGGQ